MTMTDTASRTGASPTTTVRSPLRSVGVPTEHGGWGLTTEPIVLGLAIAPSVAGLCLGVAAIVAFLARTPLRVVLVDRHRNRDLDRTALARRILLVEVATIVALVVAAAITARGSFWWPAVVAAPLVPTELWFDTRSRSRRLVPELAGTYGICSVAAMILLAGEHQPAEAIAAWMILASRATTAIPHVRAQVARLHQRPWSSTDLFVTDLAALAISTAAVAVDPAVATGAVAVAGVVAIQRITACTPVPAKVIGIRQTILGLAVVAATVAGIHIV
jgi:YwiC-like protein